MVPKFAPPAPARMVHDSVHGALRLQTDYERCGEGKKTTIELIYRLKNRNQRLRQIIIFLDIVVVPSNALGYRG